MVNRKTDKCKYESEVSICTNRMWKKDDSYCIFHSKQVNEKKDCFRIEFEKYIKNLEKEQKEPERFYLMDGFIFPETLHLSDKILHSPLYLTDCTIYGNVEIQRCQLNSVFIITKSSVAGDINIRESQFNKIFRITRNEIKLHLICHYNIHTANVAVRKNQVQGYCLFNFCSFSANLEISDMIVAKAWYIFGTDFSSSSRAYFRNLDFTKAFFMDSKLSDIEFRDINWKIQKGRLLIGDEEILTTNNLPQEYPAKDGSGLRRNEPIVETLYLQLCASYEKSRLFDLAGSFYISAMEMKRRARGNWLNRYIFSWEAWYKYISNYGQSSARATWAIILVVTLCSIIICFDSNISPLSNRLASKGIFQNFLLATNTFLEATKYNLYSLIHPAGWTFQEKISLTAFVTAWERIVVILLGTFFLLSLKRRFRRN